MNGYFIYLEVQTGKMLVFTFQVVCRVWFSTVSLGLVSLTTMHHLYMHNNNVQMEAKVVTSVIFHSVIREWVSYILHH